MAVEWFWRGASMTGRHAAAAQGAAQGVGNFPRRCEFLRGNMEIVRWENGRALRVNSPGAVDILLPETLPDGFTIEFDAFVSSFVNDFNVYPVDASGEPTGPQHIQIDPYGGVEVASFRSGAPGARSAVLRFDFNDVRDQPIYIGPVRIAASDKSLYDSLLADGRAATQGILFATGSAELRPESTPTLEDIADALRQDASMRLRIEGHTDNVGDAAVNQRLSEQRAQSVVQYLLQRKGIDASRLESVGFGQERPAADNGSPEGRQTNRRIDLLVLVPKRAG